MIAPEVMMRDNHSYTADYFAIGVLTYELMMGKVIYNSIIKKYINIFG
jgi:serine/threonine kinase 32